MTSTATAASRAANRPDQTCAAAVELARDAILDTHVGPHLAAVSEGERVVTHLFDCTLPGYRGWRWAVTVARVSRSKHVTVCETVLLPGEEALLAPAWVPWQERLQPGDLGVGDLLPTRADDDRLAPGYVLSDDTAVEEASWELGLGRSRVMSREGRADTAQRWYDGDHGPEAPISVAAPSNARCGTCGFYLPLSGSLRLIFGACGNVYAPDDGRVVSADHGCGAHSEVLVETVAPVEELPTVYDDAEVEPVELPSGDTTGESSGEANGGTDEPVAGADDAAAVDVAAADEAAVADTAVAETAVDVTATNAMSGEGDGSVQESAKTDDAPADADVTDRGASADRAIGVAAVTVGDTGARPGAGGDLGAGEVGDADSTAAAVGDPEGVRGAVGAAPAGATDVDVETAGETRADEDPAAVGGESAAPAAVAPDADVSEPPAGDGSAAGTGHEQ